MNVSILMNANEIPDYSKVRKITGSTWYTLRTNLKIYDEEGKLIEIPSEVGSIFLIGERGQINSFNPTKELVWRTTLDVLNSFEVENK